MIFYKNCIYISKSALSRIYETSDRNYKLAILTILVIAVRLGRRKENWMTLLPPDTSNGRCKYYVNKRLFTIIFASWSKREASPSEWKFKNMYFHSQRTSPDLCLHFIFTREMKLLVIKCRSEISLTCLVLSIP